MQIPLSKFSLSTKKKSHQYLHIFFLHCFAFSIQYFFLLLPPPCITLPICCPLVQNGVSQKTPYKTMETILLLPSLLLASATADSEAREVDLHSTGISMLSVNQGCSKHFLFCLTVLQILEILIVCMLDATKDKIKCVSQVKYET